MSKKAPQFDKRKFSNKPYSRKVDKPWGYEIHLVEPDSPYMLKIIHINKGSRLSLQLHDAKTETWTLINGEASAFWENSKAEIVETALEKGLGYTSQIGQRHRLVGKTDCDIVEASTPEIGITWRLEDDYKRPDETPEQRATERGDKLL